MQFSVIVPFLNEEQFIERCIQALLSQSFDRQQYELIFIDNGSTDRSADIVKQHPITLLHESRQDPYLARNRGIQAAKGTFLAFTDADCIADPHWLTRLSQTIKTRNADIVIGSLHHPAPASTLVKDYAHFYHTKLKYIYDQQLTPCYFGHGGNMAVRATVFQTVGLFSGMPIVGDTEVIHQLLEHQTDAHIVYAPQAKVTHAEITKFHHCVSKMFEYGQYLETYRMLSSYRPLHLKEKFQVFKAYWANPSEKKSSRNFIALFWILTVGFFSFEGGRWWRWMGTTFSPKT